MRCEWVILLSNFVFILSVILGCGLACTCISFSWFIWYLIQCKKVALFFPMCILNIRPLIYRKKKKLCPWWWVILAATNFSCDYEWVCIVPIHVVKHWINDVHIRNLWLIFSTWRTPPNGHSSNIHACTHLQGIHIFT
jgi:hypothetical protein